MFSNNPNICIENPRRSSISSACPSSSSSFSSIDTPDSSGTTSPLWPSAAQSFAFTMNTTMKDIQPEGLADFSGYHADVMPLTFTTYPYENQQFSDYEDPFFTLSIPMQTSSPNTSSVYDYGSDHATKGSYFEDEGFSPLSTHDDSNGKAQNSCDVYGSPVKREKTKRPKCNAQWPVTVQPGKFKCSHEGCTTTKKFVRAEHLKRHERTHDQSGKHDVFCRWCRQKFSRADNCRDHEWRHAIPTQSGKSSKRVKFYPDAKEKLESEKFDRGRKPAAARISKAKTTRAMDKLSLL